MSDGFDLTTLLFLVLAVIIFLRLRSVLGRRTGNERPPYDPYSARDGREPKPAGTGDVISLPRREPRADTVEARAPSAEDIEARVRPHAAKGSPLEASLGELVSADPNFDPDHFLTGARAAYEMIVTSFASSDRRTLKQLLAKEVYDGFIEALNQREERGETVEMSFVGINRADIMEAELKGRTAHVTVKFVSQLISATRDGDGDVIEGDPKRVREVTDIWTFARDLSSRDPNWKLAATESEN
jgi:predicted lipid-binding transport protein (Tim44 family)